MRRKKGLIDITYCNAMCVQEDCKRNLRYYKPPTSHCSVCNFAKDDTDTLHSKCSYKYIKGEN